MRRADCGIDFGAASAIPKISRTCEKVSSVVSSSNEIRTSVELTRAKLIPAAAAFLWIEAASTTSTVTVSKTRPLRDCEATCKREAKLFTRSAIARSPAGPCHIA